MQINNHNGHDIWPGSNHRLWLNPEDVLVPDGWHEAAIEMNVHGKKLDATVPVSVLGPERNILPVKVLEIDANDIVVVVLPVGNDGIQRWGIPKEVFLDKVVREA